MKQNKYAQLQAEMMCFQLDLEYHIENLDYMLGYTTKKPEYIND